MSSPQQLYHQLHRHLKQFEKWGRPELVQTLAYMMVGIFMNRDVRLSRIAEDVPLGIQEESLAQRFRRWLKNPTVDERAIYDPMMCNLLAGLRHTRLRFQIDRTTIEDRFNVLVISLYYRKRAIPIVWQVLPHQGSSSWQDWRDLCAHLADLVPEESEIIILGDREFGQSELMRLIRAYGWHFCLRCKGNYKVRYNGLWFSLREWIPTQGQQRFFSETTFAKSNPIDGIHWSLSWAPDSKEAWIIASDLPPSPRVLREYARRFACEELFFDIKKRGFNLEETRLQLSKLFLVVALLYVWVLCLGRRVRLTRQVRTLTYRGRDNRYSLFQIGRRWIKKQLALGNQMLQTIDEQPWRLVYKK